MVSDSAVFISRKQSGTLPDGHETASAMIADDLQYMKTRLGVGTKSTYDICDFYLH